MGLDPVPLKNGTPCPGMPYQNSPVSMIETNGAEDKSSCAEMPAARAFSNRAPARHDCNASSIALLPAQLASS